MEPKFQSSFIPKGPLATGISSPAGYKTAKKKNFLVFLALIVFIISFSLAAGVFGYKFYLKYSIDAMGTDLKNARATLEPDTIRELIRLDDRINSIQELIATHEIVSPLFEFLEASTPKTVRFTEFQYSSSGKGLELVMKGEARGYASLALLADIFSKSPYFRDSIFSDLNLNDRGDVRFSFRTVVDQTIVSYTRKVESLRLPVVATSTATSTSTN